MLYLEREGHQYQDLFMSKNNESNNTKNNKISDDTLDGIAALTLIAVAVTGVVFWLSGMPY